MKILIGPWTDGKLIAVDLEPGERISVAGENDSSNFVELRMDERRHITIRLIRDGKEAYTINFKEDKKEVQPKSEAGHD